MDFDSWDAYINDQFGQRLPRFQSNDERRQVVWDLSESGMSQWAIAAATGVSVGTVNQALKDQQVFKTERLLIVAVLQHEIDECAEAAEELGTALSPWEALMGWIERFTDFVGTKRGLASALHSGDPAYDDLPQLLMERLEPALQTLFARAVDGGCARDDVTAREVLMTIALICQPVRGEQPSFNQRMTRVFMEGLGRALAGAVDAEPPPVSAWQRHGST